MNGNPHDRFHRSNAKWLRGPLFLGAVLSALASTRGHSRKVSVSVIHRLTATGPSTLTSAIAHPCRNRCLSGPSRHLGPFATRWYLRWSIRAATGTPVSHRLTAVACITLTSAIAHSWCNRCLDDSSRHLSPFATRWHLRWSVRVATGASVIHRLTLASRPERW